MEDLFYRELTRILKAKGVQKNEPLSRHTTFRIGGPADYFAVPSCTRELKDVLLLCKQEKVPYMILGNGSNLLVSDFGFRGVVIHNEFKTLPKLQEEKRGILLSADADLPLSKISLFAAEAGLEGLEFAAGIPGSFGGAVVMNAGAYGSEIKDFLVSVDVLDEFGQEKTLQKQQLQYGYRTSIFQSISDVVLRAVFLLKQGEKEQIKAKINQYAQTRKEKQPLEYPSAGSTFKRPEGNYAGKLIMEAGLKGVKVGGAQVSEKHCGFVINTGEATSQDVIRLMQMIQQRVKEQSGILLEPEIKMVGEFPETW